MKAFLLVGMIKAKLFPKVLSYKSLYHLLKRDLIEAATTDAYVKGPTMRFGGGGGGGGGGKE